MRKRSEKEVIVAEYLSGHYSYRELSVKHDYSLGAVHKWVKQYTDRMGKTVVKRKVVVKRKAVSLPIAEDTCPMPTDIKVLQAELRKAQLLNKLLNEVIVIAEEEFGLPIRKKPGTKQS